MTNFFQTSIFFVLIGLFATGCASKKAISLPSIKAIEVMQGMTKLKTDKIGLQKSDIEVLANQVCKNERQNCTIEVEFQNETKIKVSETGAKAAVDGVLEGISALRKM